METVEKYARELRVDFIPAVFYDCLGAVASIYQVIIPITDLYWRLYALCESRNRVMLLCINKNPFSVGVLEYHQKRVTTSI